MKDKVIRKRTLRVINEDGNAVEVAEDGVPFVINATEPEVREELEDLPGWRENIRSTNSLLDDNI